MVYDADQNDKLSVLDGVIEAHLPSRLTVQLQYFDHAFLDNAQ